MKLLSAVIFNNLIGILTACQLQDSYFQTRLSENSDCTLGCLLTCLIGIIGKNNLVGISRNQSRLFLRKCSSETGDGISKSCLMKRDNIHIALADYQAARVTVLGKVQRKYAVAFLINKRVRCVDILRLRVVKHTSAESYNISS